MSNTYAYKVTNLVCNSEGIVVSTEFNITVSDGVDSFTHNYVTAFANTPVTPIPFNKLVEANVVEWIKRDAGANNHYEASADAELEAYKLRKSAPVISSGTPW